MTNGVRSLTETVIDLPPPPSVNRLWRRGTKGMVLSPAYVAWRVQADKLALASGAFRGRVRIDGAFEAHVTLARGRRGDLDNYGSKAVLDWAQSRELIENDKHCQRLVVEYGEAPHGCRLILRGI
jgi:Holliday junction resolvase RusA-like endonuclease